MPESLRVFVRAVEAGDDGAAEAAASALTGKDGKTLPTLERMLSEPDPDVRWWALRGLAAVGGETAADLTIQALTDPDADIRACAVVALAHLRAPAAIDPLVARLADPSAYVSRLAADALSRFGPIAVEPLIAVLTEGSTAQRAGAARALRTLQSPESIPALYSALDDPSAVVTHYVEDALDRMGVGLILFRP